MYYFHKFPFRPLIFILKKQLLLIKYNKIMSQIKKIYFFVFISFCSTKLYFVLKISLSFVKYFIWRQNYD